MTIHKCTPETSYIIDPIAPRLSANGVNSLKLQYKRSSRRLHRFCFHQNPSVDLHDIIICYDKDTYIPPNKHIGKVESLLVLSGIVDVYFFNDAGKVFDHRRLSNFDSEHPFYLRVPQNTWHGLKVVSNGPCIIKETIAGPYDSSSLQWGAFAPSLKNETEKGLQWYENIKAECKQKMIKAPPHEKFQNLSKTVFRSSRHIITVSKHQLEPIVAAAKASSLKRARLCCHGGTEEKVQEMFIALARNVHIEESVHIKKDESLTVLDGDGYYSFPNEDGMIRQKVKLASFNCAKGKNSFYVRINRFVPHKIHVNSSVLLIHEATTGPFQAIDTAYRIQRIRA